MIRPLPLHPGDAVAVVAPSSQLRTEQQRLAEQAFQILNEEWDLQLKYTPELTRSHLHLAGSDQERAAEFQQQLEDENIRAIFCIRGGYGVARLLPMLRPDTWHDQPKWLIGFSDCSLLLHYLQRHTDWLVCHGPTLASSQFVGGPQADKNREALRNVLFNSISPSSPVQFLQNLKSVEGRLSGGCLSIILSALGTKAQIDLANSILFLEEVYEAPYRLDRMLTQMRQSGQFEQVRAFVFGEFVECGTPDQVKNVLLDVLGDLNLPMAIGLPHGHGEINHPILLGQWAELDAQQNAIHFKNNKP
jgi:muramoyltetrapeptide carboxypeptidase